MFTWLGVAWGWLQNNPVVARIIGWVAAIGALFAIKEAWEANVAAGVRRQERDAREKEALRTSAAAKGERMEIIKTEVRSANEALEARDAAPAYPDADSVRPETADVLFRTSGRR